MFTLAITSAAIRKPPPMRYRCLRRFWHGAWSDDHYFSNA